MRLISAHAGKLLTLDSELSSAYARPGFATGLKPLDNLLPDGLFARGAVHELLNEPQDPQALTFAMLLARSGVWGVEKECGVKETGERRGLNPKPETRNPKQIRSPKSEKEEAVSPDDNQTPPTTSPTITQSSVLSPQSYSPPTQSSVLSPQSYPPLATVILDPAGEIYPPAVAAMGIPLERVYFLQPRDKADQLWAIAECLRCSAVGAVVAAPPPLSRVDARKLQLAAERGGGIGILLRPLGQSPHYAAATRWLIRPTPGERTIQRWHIQLLHAPGGQVGQSVILELSRQTLQLRAVTPQAKPETQSPATPLVS